MVMYRDGVQLTYLTDEDFAQAIGQPLPTKQQWSS